MVERATEKVGLHSIGNLLLLYYTLILASAKVLSPQAQQQSCKLSGSTPLSAPKTPVPSGNWDDHSYVTTQLGGDPEPVHSENRHY